MFPVAYLAKASWPGSLFPPAQGVPLPALPEHWRNDFVLADVRSRIAAAGLTTADHCFLSRAPSDSAAAAEASEFPTAWIWGDTWTDRLVSVQPRELERTYNFVIHVEVRTDRTDAEGLNWIDRAESAIRNVTENKSLAGVTWPSMTTVVRSRRAGDATTPTQAVVLSYRTVFAIPDINAHLITTPAY